MKPPPRKTRPTGKSTAARPAGRKADPPPPLSPGRRWLFRLAALLLLPLLLLGGLEIVLRVAGYGHPTGFFESVRIGGKEYLVNNEDFSLRFFPPQLARWPGPVMLATPKPAGTYRVFVLGESAARGEPEPNYAASRYLQTLLTERFPQTRFEVVNLGITAIDSHVILPIARDCARAGGDLWIIYMGNNEMVGPFGAATVFGQKAPPLAFVRLTLAIQKTRIGQLLADLGRHLKGNDSNASWGGMKMFVGNQLRADDPRKEVVYENFARNLDDILRAGRKSGARILLNTVAVNLRDSPPFASMINSNLPSDQRAQFTQLCDAAKAAWAQTNFVVATNDFARAARLDPLNPDLHYQWAQCLLGLRDEAGARRHYQLACDDDALPFRADSRINAAIQKAGSRLAGENLTVFDAAAALAHQAPDGLCGSETFYEHVHFTFDGNYRLGRAWADQVAGILPDTIAHGEITNGWTSQEVCDRRLGLTDWNRGAVTEMVIDRLHHAPLSGQANNAERLSSLRAEVARLRHGMDAAAASNAVALYEDAIRHAPEDHLVVENFAEFLESINDLKDAAIQWQRDTELMPHDCEAWYQSGRVLSSLEQWTPAEAALREATVLRPRLTEAWYELGTVHLGTGQFDSALRDYQRAAALDPTDAIYRSYIGKAYSKLNRHAEALLNYQQALQMDPNLWETHFALGDELVNAGQISEAGKEYAEVIRLKPGNVLAHLNVGVMEARQGLYEAAVAQFEETLQLDPANEQARDYLSRVQERLNHQR